MSGQEKRVRPAQDLRVEDYKGGEQATAANKLLHELFKIDNPTVLDNQTLITIIHGLVNDDPYFKDRDNANIQKALFNSFRDRYPFDVKSVNVTVEGYSGPQAEAANEILGNLLQLPDAITMNDQALLSAIHNMTKAAAFFAPRYEGEFEKDRPGKYPYIETALFNAFRTVFPKQY